MYRLGQSENVIEREETTRSKTAPAKKQTSDSILDLIKTKLEEIQKAAINPPKRR